MPFEPTSPSTDTDSLLQRYAATSRFRAGRPVGVTIAPGGKSVLLLRSGPQDLVQKLYEHRVDSGEERLVADPAVLLAGGEEDLSQEELARRERMRMPARGIAAFRLVPHTDSVLVHVGGRVFLVDRDSGEHRELPGEGGPAIDPRPSPDGKSLACVRGRDLFVIDIESGTQRRLTESTTDTLTNGLAEFVAQEEMHRMRGFWWSPDSKFIAFQQNDESAVELLHIADPFNPAKPPASFRYPRAGTTNADVRLGILPIEGGQPTWVDWDRTALPYLATVKWPKRGPLTLVIQNREQTEEHVLTVDPTTGATTLLHTETDSAWLNLDQSFPRWLADGSGFLWMTERRGMCQVELRDAQGMLVREVTRPEDCFQKLLEVDDEQGILWAQTARDPVAWHVEPFGIREPLSQTRAGNGDRVETSAVFRLRTDVAVRITTPIEGPMTWEVCRVSGNTLGEPVGTLLSVAETPPAVNLELVELGGPLELTASVIRPNDFDPSRKYPVLVSVYGGPGLQMVRAGRVSLALDQWTADQGFVVVTADGRGTPARGRDWERAIRGDFAKLPLNDQVEALRLLSEKLPELDTSRVGIYGWSFGGYLSAMAVTRRPDVFHAAVSGAPVVDFRGYDTHYTERYLGLPQDQPDAYHASDLLTFAPDLTQPLLIIHGTADDNCYFSGSLRLSDAILRAGAEHELLPLASQTHMVTEPALVEQIYERSVAFFKKHLAAH